MSANTAILTTADGEYRYEPKAPYVLSEPGSDYEHAIVRTADGEVLGTDGWQQAMCVEDATFTRDLAWIVPELNRQADEIERLRAALYWAHVGTSDDPAEVVVLDHSTGTARLAKNGRCQP